MPPLPRRPITSYAPSLEPASSVMRESSRFAAEAERPHEAMQVVRVEAEGARRARDAPRLRESVLDEAPFRLEDDFLEAARELAVALRRRAERLGEVVRLDELAAPEK